MNMILAQKRDPAVKVKQLRRLGMIPCVIDGAELEQSLSIQIDQSVARKLKSTKRNGSKIKIKIDEETYSTLIKDLECNKLNGEVVHICFHILNAGKKVNSIADIVLINKDKVAGVLEQMQMQIPHAALPEYLIDTVTVDLENMPVGTTLTVGDIPEFQNDNIELQADASNIVLRISDKKRVETGIEQS